MRDERGHLTADLRIDEPFTLWGSVAGTVTVVAGGKFYLRGRLYGSLDVHDGGRVHIFGDVQGDLIVHAGAKVIHSGTVGKDVINRGGRVHIELASKILGKVKTRGGSTTFEKVQRVTD